ncbi:hypothetical protein [Haloarcula marina]|uniref:hypothetical protein n=1 Tax=Haloarcula marina TaxID=2961574 RepID=UPI0020B86697|nr:hypothetical protein [Halomicroarcula marina]
MGDHPIEAQLVLLAGTQASVPLDRLPDLLERAQTHIETRREEFERRYERISGARDADYYCVGPEYWEAAGETLGFNRREWEAVRRAHEAQFSRDGRRLDREGEFESTLEIRSVVAVGATR